MPEAATKTATTPRRTRKTPAAKPAASASKPATAPPADDGMMKIQLELDAAGETKSYAVFTPPAGSGCVGKFYAPLGTEQIKVLLIGPADAVAEVAE